MEMQVNPVLSAAHLAFIGAGSMAEAIIRGLIHTNKIPASQISAINRSNTQRLAALQEKYGIDAASFDHEPQAAEQYIRQADIIVLAVKPKDAAGSIARLRALLCTDEPKLIISVLAGTSIATIHMLLGRPLPIIRTMPNTSSSIGAGATGLCCSTQVSDSERQIALEIFEAIGVVCEVEERWMDLVTGLSGSGPAYVYSFVEGLVQGGIAGGLTPETARMLAIQTVAGAAEMLRTTGEEPGELRRQVTSPNGTTQAALEWLTDRGFTDAVAGAVLRAAERSREIGDQLTREAWAADSESPVD